MSASECNVVDHVVAFIDILGSSEAISRDANSSLNIVHQAYKKSLEGFGNIFTGAQFQPAVKIFSDNIVVAVPCKDKQFEPVAFLAVAMMSAVIQVEFLKKGWLTRGGICTGSFFADDIMVWGKGLVDAYTIENTVAVYPRIVIDPALIGHLRSFEELDAKTSVWLQQDNDGMFYINYINHYLNHASFFALRLTQIVEQNISRFRDKARICQKWLWLSYYLNKRFLELDCSTSVVEKKD